jgi:hypothetical protein
MVAAISVAARADPGACVVVMVAAISVSARLDEQPTPRLAVITTIRQATEL